MEPKRTRLLLSQAVDGFLLAKGAEGRSEHTLSDYAYCLRMFREWLNDDPPVADLTTHDVREFLVYLRGTDLSAKTIKNVHTALASMWSWLEAEEGLPHIVKAIKPPRAAAPEFRLPDKDDMAALLQACDYSGDAQTKHRRGFKMRRSTALRDRTLVLFFLDTGVRVSELCDLTLKDIDLKTGGVLVRHGKGNKPRQVYMGKALRKQVWRYVTVHRSDEPETAPLFVTREGRPLDRYAVEHLVRRLGERAGVEVHPHLLRHVFATEFLRGGGSTLALRRLLGHVSDALLTRYAQIVEADLRAAHEAASPADRWRL